MSGNALRKREQKCLKEWIKKKKNNDRWERKNELRGRY